MPVETAGPRAPPDRLQTDAVETVTEPAGVLLSTGKVAYLNPKSRHSFTTTAALVAPLQGLYDALLKWYPNVKSMGFSAHDEAGAVAVSKLARDVAKAHGLALYETVLTTFGTKEYYPTWTKIMKDKPGAVDIGVGFPESLAANIRQGRELGFKGPIMTPNTGDANTFVSLIGKDMAVDVLYAGMDPNAPDTPPMVKEIAKLWTEKFNRAFNVDALDGFSSIWALTQAIEKAQSLEPDKVAKTWETMTTIETPWGKGKMGGQKAFGINHMVLPPAVVSQLMKGKVTGTHWYQPDL